MTIWVYKSSAGECLLNGGGYPAYLGPSGNIVRHYPSAKITVWADKDAALAFLKRTGQRSGSKQSGRGAKQ